MVTACRPNAARASSSVSAAVRPAGEPDLGLYIVRRIVEKHGGSVAFAERAPRGSAFTMTFPAAA